MTVRRKAAVDTATPPHVCRRKVIHAAPHNWSQTRGTPLDVLAEKLMPDLTVGNTEMMPVGARHHSYPSPHPIRLGNSTQPTFKAARPNTVDGLLLLVVRTP